MTRWNAIWLAVAAALLIAVPAIIGNEFYVNMASQVLIYALFALSINMMLGYGGMVSLGHAGYLGLAGYACILLTINGFDQLSAAILALVFSTAMAGLFGMLSLRAPGLGFIMITLALGQIVWGIAYRANTLTGGDNGFAFRRGPCRSASTSTARRASTISRWSCSRSRCSSSGAFPARRSARA